MPRTDLATGDLQAGDLIVWKTGDSDANHVEMFTGNSHFAETSIHAVNPPAKDLPRVMATYKSALDTNRAAAAGCRAPFARP